MDDDAAPPRARGGIARLARSRVGAVGAAAIVVGVLVLGEVAVRVLEPNLPPPRVGDEQEAYVKVDQMEALAASGERVDVVFVGASGVDAGIAPEVFDGASESFEGAYNAALVGMPPEFILRWTREIVLAHLDPEVVVIGINPQQLSARQGVEADRLWGLSAAFDGTLRDLSPGLLADLEDEVAGRSELVRYRRQLRSPTGIVRAIRDRATGAPNVLEGVNARTAKPREFWEAELSPLGANRLYAEVPDEVLLDPEMAARLTDWHQGGTRTATIEALLDGLGDEVPVMLFIPPTDLETLARSGMDPTLWDESLAQVARLAAVRGVPFVDYTHADFAPLEFHDKGHLASPGAIHLSEDLAGRVEEACRIGLLAPCAPEG